MKFDNAADVKPYAVTIKLDLLILVLLEDITLVKEKYEGTSTFS